MAQRLQLACLVLYDGHVVSGPERYRDEPLGFIECRLDRVVDEHSASIALPLG